MPNELTFSFDAPDIDAPDKVRVCMGMLDSQLSAKILAISVSYQSIVQDLSEFYLARVYGFVSSLSCSLAEQRRVLIRRVPKNFRVISISFRSLYEGWLSSFDDLSTSRNNYS